MTSDLSRVARRPAGFRRLFDISSELLRNLPLMLGGSSLGVQAMGCDDDALMAGANLALVGSEILQFGAVEPLGDGAFRLSRMLRGRGGTEWAIAGHQAGESFLMINASSLRQIPVSSWSNGSEVTATQVGVPAASASLTITGDSLKPWTPVDLGAESDAGGDLQISWTRRSRVRADWIDDVDMPLGERDELYGIVVSNGDASIEYSSGTPSVAVPAADLASLGAVRQ